MAREVRFPIARAYSQLIPRLIPRTCGQAALAQHARCRVILDRLEGEELAPEPTQIHCKPKAGQRLAARDVPQFEGKALEGGQAAGLEMEVRDLEAPAAGLPPACLRTIR